MDKYRKIKVIGKGAFGAAVLVECRADKRLQYVIKQVDVSRLKPKERDEAKKEIKLLASFHHPNIVHYRDSFLENGHLHIVMDYADGGDLANLLKEQGTRHLPEDQVLDYFVQICLAMKHVHDRKVLHRDIKSQNVFLTQNRKVVKLGDFGIARVLNATAELAKTACGTPYYMSPEMYRRERYSYKNDVWAVGCVLFELVALQTAFHGRNVREYERLASGLAPYSHEAQSHFWTGTAPYVLTLYDVLPASVPIVVAWSPALERMFAMLDVDPRRLVRFDTAATYYAKVLYSVVPSPYGAHGALGGEPSGAPAFACVQKHMSSLQSQRINALVGSQVR